MEGSYIKIKNIIVDYYLNTLKEKEQLFINTNLYEDSLIIIEGLIKVRLEGILSFIKKITYFIIKSEDNKQIKKKNIDNPFQKNKFEVKIIKKYKDFNINDTIKVFQLFKYKGLKDKTAFFFENKNNEKNTIPVIYTNIKPKILKNYKNNLISKLNNLYKILFKNYIFHDNSLSDLDTNKYLNEKIEKCYILLNKYKE